MDRIFICSRFRASTASLISLLSLSITSKLKSFMVSKQELKDLILKLLNNLIEKNSDHLFEPSFFPSEQLSYVNWVRKSLLLLGWKVRNGEDSVNKIFSNLFAKNGMIVGIIVFSETTKVNIDQKQYHHYMNEVILIFRLLLPQMVGILKMSKYPIELLL